VKSARGKIKSTTLLLAGCAISASAHADHVLLTNGDKLSGQVITQDESSLTLEHAVLGQIVIQRTRITQVVTGDSTTDQPAQPSPTPPESGSSEGTEAPLEQAREDAIQAAQRSDSSTFDLLQSQWKHKLALGLNGASGTTDQQQYYAKIDSRYEDDHDRWLFNSRWHYAVTDGAQTRNQVETNLTKDWLVPDKPWFFFLKGQHKYDNNREWENRASTFGGGGYTLAKTENIEVNTRIGCGGTYEFGHIDEFTPEALFGGSVVQWNITQRTAIAAESTYFPSLQDTANFRVESKLELNYKLDLAKGLSLKVGLENEYDSSTPNDPGNNDLIYYGALVVQF